MRGRILWGIEMLAWTLFYIDCLILIPVTIGASRFQGPPDLGLIVCVLVGIAARWFRLGDDWDS